MAKFPGVDYLLIDSQLKEQEKMVRQTSGPCMESAGCSLAIPLDGVSDL
jgi:hypothetical protein